MSSTNKTQLNIHIENIVPVLSVKDMNASRAFYIGILGFEEAEWGSDDFTSIGRDRWGIYFCKGAQGNPGTWIWIGFGGDIIALHEELKSKGVAIKLPPTNFSWAMEMQIEDPDGHVLRFATDPDSHKPFADQEQ
jgi:catechol 2,3-dioxygenase-like lactoylglutathione lyase family enzyme